MTQLKVKQVTTTIYKCYVSINCESWPISHWTYAVTHAKHAYGIAFKTSVAFNNRLLKDSMGKKKSPALVQKAQKPETSSPYRLLLQQ